MFDLGWETRAARGMFRLDVLYCSDMDLNTRGEGRANMRGRGYPLTAISLQFAIQRSPEPQFIVEPVAMGGLNACTVSFYCALLEDNSAQRLRANLGEVYDLFSMITAYVVTARA